MVQPEFRRELVPVFNTGRYGIMVFFLVGGYIIPASLERRRCVRTFWIGRLFRLYPLLVVVVAAVLAAKLPGIPAIHGFGGQSAATVALAHATLLQELLGTPSLVLVLWTLSHEMAFYLVVTGLFTIGRHRSSAAVAATLAVCAAVSVAAGVVLPVSALSGRSPSTRTGWVVAFLPALLTFGAGLALRHRRIPRWLIGLGTVSYSVYQVHPPLLGVWDGSVGRLRHDNGLLERAFYVVLLSLCVVIYRSIEAPAQKWGRKLLRRLETR